MASVSLDGFIHPDITKLTYLRTLDLSNNQLHDSIPSNLGNLSNLTKLDLSSNQLTGIIPLSLGNLKNVTELYLWKNLLTGIIPPSLGNLNSLNTLSLFFNKLSGATPHELGKLSQLQILYLDDNELNGTLPKEFGNLRNLRALWVTSNYLTGEVPKEYEQLVSLEEFIVGGNNMSGTIPSFIANWTNLNTLNLLGNNFTRELPPTIFNMSSLVILQVSDLKSTGFAFPISSNLTSIETLELSFNNLKGGIPDSFKILSLETMLLTGNKLNGKIPDWINGTITRMGAPPKVLDDHCNGKNSQYHSLFINAGGEDVKIGGKHYDADISPKAFYVDPTKRWAYVCSGDFLSTTANSSDYMGNTSGVSAPEATLYDKARICPQSLTYYGFCLHEGKYTVELDFAEIVFSKDEDYSSNGKRVFDVYIQGTRVMEDFNIKKEDGGPNKWCTKSFKAKVDNNLLEIRLFWAGKGSLYNPPKLNGPLISAISVTPDFQIGVLSTKWIVVIVIAVVSALVLALLLLWAFMLRMAWVGDRELINTIVKIRDKEYSLKEVIVATGNFGPQNEISQMVYKATLRDQEKPVAVKKLPLHTKQFDQITNEVYAGQKLKHDNLVELLAVCSNKKKKIYLIIYEYMENGSLQQALFDDSNVQRQLDWQRRVEICRGIAKAMLYGEDEPYDFLHKIATGFTYMAPEVLRRESIMDKADVYSTGIVLIEIISGQSNSKDEGNKETESLLQRAAVLHNRGSYSGLVDQKLTSYDMRQVVAIFDLAMRCVDQTPTLRPKMSEVVSELERI
ncbi:hypothetical protein Patl1_09719 [Pistacia atlantica]|uniref:Uncharacterized protein n=1 Tax=Pistacia atlantica TaxID=434234 RepID=A0ACC1A646_9ROSI|nr:hypothetical protein Patl1_09719 [Pistacia atlantica]